MNNTPQIRMLRAKWKAKLFSKRNITKKDIEQYNNDVKKLKV